MPERIIIYLSFLKSLAIEWKILLGSVTIAIAAPYLDLVYRFFVPIISGIVWVFLKPYVIKIKDKYNQKRIQK